MGLRMSAAWGCTQARCGAAQERCVGLRMGCAKGPVWGGGGASPQAFGVCPAKALTRRILVPGLLARCVASPQAVRLAL